MKIIITGGADYAPTERERYWLDSFKEHLPITEIVSGGTPGVAVWAEDWARRHDLPVTRFEADYNTLGPAAEGARDAKMIEYADGLLAFPGGNAVEALTIKARQADLLVAVVQKREEGIRFIWARSFFSIPMTSDFQTHLCHVCGADAAFGVGPPASRDDHTYWFCRDHRAVLGVAQTLYADRLKEICEYDKKEVDTAGDSL